MSNAAIVPTFILQIDGFFREGLRLILSRTRFSPQGWGIALDELNAIPSDEPSLFIVGVGQKHDFIFKRIRALYPLSFIVAIGDERSPDCLASALDAGVNAALFNSVAPNALINCLHAVTDEHLIVIDGRLWPLATVLPKIDERLSPPTQNGAPWEAESALHASKLLSAREIAILERIVRGDSNKHVARYFKIAEPTVKAHVKAIFRKIGTTNRTQAAIWALNNKLINGAHGISTLLDEHVAGDESHSLGFNQLDPTIDDALIAGRAKVGSQ
ncbi:MULTISPECIES: response regulator transcription factor [unclassified Bradyrhizobium]|uniref:response regulator transcription factor n=1 Tax=unclassified Bradyrhizobium TaxID=2631580 RepID=UPI00247B24EF|nr:MULTISPECIES: response regulator transcription factor [unclassified Bradyrhizobium]WGS17356.1 response regulator transcription factor [Bradyrhizobium sp. ISRA463]WGS31092.1 response regulator transcription factor [Bradyrhizobium sp. ISRA464]